MIYGSVCSGIEAASVAWHPLGWRPAFFSEIEPFPRAVLAERWPGVPIHGDFTTIKEGDYEPIELLVGGTPCQDFSVAGLRAGLAGDRGGLTIEFVHLARRLRPRWLVWENVPGILSIDDGRAFGAFLALLGQCGYGFAYRILDAQHFGVPQRRRRVFVVGYLGDWRPAAAVLFEPESLRGDPAPRREAGERVAPTIEAGANRTGGPRPPGTTVDTADSLIAKTLSASRGAACANADDLETYISIAFSAKDHGGDASDISPTLRAGGFTKSHANAGVMPAVAAFESRYARNGRGAPSELVPPLKAQSGESGKGDAAPLLMSGMTVRRLTPRECERLQGFPDDYTAITARGKPAADGPRYRALGNSMAVPCMAWIGARIDGVFSR